MIVGVGIDVCDVDRFAESMQRRPGLVRRIFTPAEAERPVASKAARFAAKEALAKALGAPDGLSWLDAEVVTDDHGKPSFKIMGTVAARAAEQRGQTAAEYLGIVVVVAAIIAAIVGAGLDDKIAGALEKAVDSITGGGGKKGG